MEPPEVETQTKKVGGSKKIFYLHCLLPPYSKITMKNLLLFALLSMALLFASCKKQYSCQCSTTFERDGYYPYTVSSVEPIDQKTSKKRAEQICANAEKQMYKNNDDYASPSETLSTSCAVK
jgi:hypothetical protein